MEHHPTPIAQLEVFRQNSRRLQLESFKIDSILNLLNNCSDRCHLQYKESGTKAVEGAEDVECFNTCVKKSHAINRLVSE